MLGNWKGDRYLTSKRHSTGIKGAAEELGSQRKGHHPPAVCPREAKQKRQWLWHATSNREGQPSLEMAAFHEHWPKWPLNNNNGMKSDVQPDRKASPNLKTFGKGKNNKMSKTELWIAIWLKHMKLCKVSLFTYFSPRILDVLHAMQRKPSLKTWKV